jgi:hypothetical protein
VLVVGIVGIVVLGFETIGIVLETIGIILVILLGSKVVVGIILLGSKVVVGICFAIDVS